MSKSYSKTRVLVECALMVAIGTVLANIKIFTMPNGGSVTLSEDVTIEAAFSDSINDLPMLAFAAERGEAFAVNPDGMLRSEAARRGWRIMDIFKKDRA